MSLRSIFILGSTLCLGCGSDDGSSSDDGGQKSKSKKKEKKLNNEELWSKWVDAAIEEVGGEEGVPQSEMGQVNAIVTAKMEENDWGYDLKIHSNATSAIAKLDTRTSRCESDYSLFPFIGWAFTVRCYGEATLAETFSRDAELSMRCVSESGASSDADFSNIYGLDSALPGDKVELTFSQVDGCFPHPTIEIMIAPDE